MKVFQSKWNSKLTLKKEENVLAEASQLLPHSIFILSFNPHSNAKRVIWLFTFYIWKTWWSETQSNLPTQTVTRTEVVIPSQGFHPSLQLSRLYLWWIISVSNDENYSFCVGSISSLKFVLIFWKVKWALTVVTKVSKEKMKWMLQETREKLIFVFVQKILDSWEIVCSNWCPLR